MAIQHQGIYCIVNTKTNDFYVGSCVHFAYRWKKHRLELGRGSHHSKILQRAWNKYGSEVFSLRVIANAVPQEKLLQYEQGWIDKLRPKYNVARFARTSGGWNKSLKLPFKAKSEQHKRNISVALTGVPRPLASNIKSALTQKGRSPKNKGVPMTDEQRAKMRAAWVIRKARGNS